MAGFVRICVKNERSCFIPKAVEVCGLRRWYASSNRVKPFKIIEDNRARNEAKAAQMRAEATHQEAERLVVSTRNIKSIGQSLSSRGYLRPVKPYVPSEDVCTRIDEVAKANHLQDAKQKFVDNRQKFDFLLACFNTFKHSIPNSQLHEIKCVDDAKAFYQAHVDTTLPLEALQQSDLPENLYIQQDYIRFHPETDTMFGGKSAFPKSSTIVTGLKYKNKYRGHVAKKTWP